MLLVPEQTGAALRASVRLTSYRLDPKVDASEFACQTDWLSSFCCLLAHAAVAEASCDRKRVTNPMLVGYEHCSR
jgi:hypothetical protein